MRGPWVFTNNYIVYSWGCTLQLINMDMQKPWFPKRNHLRFFYIYIILIYDKQPTSPKSMVGVSFLRCFPFVRLKQPLTCQDQLDALWDTVEAEEKERRQVRKFQWLDLREESTGSPLYYQPNPWREFCQNSQPTNSGTVFFWASCEFSAVLAKHAKQICVSHGFKGSSRFCWVRTEISMPNKLVKSSWALFWGLGLVNVGLTLVVDSGGTAEVAQKSQRLQWWGKDAIACSCMGGKSGMHQPVAGGRVREGTGF